MPLPVEEFISRFESLAREKLEERISLAEKRFPTYFGKELPKIGTVESLEDVHVSVLAELTLDSPDLREKCVATCKINRLPNCENSCYDAGRTVLELGPGGWVRYVSIAIPRDKDLEEFADMAFSGICQEHSVEPITRYFSIVRGEGCRLETVASVVEQIRRWE